jgi:hypothetical protein
MRGADKRSSGSAGAVRSSEVAVRAEAHLHPDTPGGKHDVYVWEFPAGRIYGKFEKIVEADRAPKTPVRNGK